MATAAPSSGSDRRGRRRPRVACVRVKLLAALAAAAAAATTTTALVQTPVPLRAPRRSFGPSSTPRAPPPTPRRAWRSVPCAHGLDEGADVVPKGFQSGGDRRLRAGLLGVAAAVALASAAGASDPGFVAATEQVPVFEPRGITPQDTIVFVLGLVPFGWATVEFWRRIAVGEPFGTGKDSVIIGEDNNPDSSRGRRVLGQDAFIAAYILFGIAGVTLLLSIVSAVAGGQAPASYV